MIFNSSFLNISFMYVNSSGANDTGNGTAGEVQMVFNFAGISTIILLFLTVFLNVLVLFLFYRIGNMTRKPFNVFMVNLIATDLLYCVWEDVFDIGINIWPNYWMNKTPAICSVYLYANYTLQAMACNAHMLITINRLWAIIFPISYKSNQKVSVFVAICAAEWIYVHVVVFPGFFIDMLYYRKDLYETGCGLNSEAQQAWSAASMILLLDVPLSIIVGAYPFILYKHQRRQNELRRLHPTQVTQTNHVSNSKAGHQGQISHSQHVDPEEGASTVATANGNKKMGRKVALQPMLILTLLTISVVICWTPNATFYMYYAFNESNDTFAPLQPYIIFLFNVQILMDPLLFLVALSDLRAGLFGLFEKPLRWFREKGCA
ncbi:uncharacterized protein LOC129593716 [Paramacrobiotus metropolitanus]|uniref:uncharacterized protein LOC129593716 n=1 Tax=Paramacrobiotus metropolitanus TaxID=2943436 RepID=UPI0024458553|nr:uncharacterized protein LOC129593716 [Paramacrobiotus metropolitanus]